MIGDSYEIVRYLEDTYPSPPLDIPGNAEAEQATGQVFSIFSAWAKNKEEGQEAGLEVKFTQELEKIEQFLSKSSGIRGRTQLIISLLEQAFFTHTHTHTHTQAPSSVVPAGR